MKLRITQSYTRDSVERRSRDDATKRAWSAEADIIGKDQQNVGSLLGRHDPRLPVRFGIEGVEIDHPTEWRWWIWDLPSVDGRRGAGRTGRAGYLLGVYCRSRQQKEQGKNC